MGRWGSPRSLQTISTSMSFLSFAVVRRLIPVFFFFKQKTAYEIGQRLEFRRVLFRSSGQSESIRVIAGHFITAVLASNHVSRSEEHTSELQSLTNLVCRLLLEKKK